MENIKRREHNKFLFSPLPRKQKLIILYFILACALFLRLGHWLDVHHDPFFSQLIMDSQEYDRWAIEIASGHWLGSQIFFQAPLYPYLMAVAYKVFGHYLDIIYLFQILAAVAGCYALYRAGRKIAGDKVGLAAAALAAAYSIFIFYDVQVLKESLAVTLVSFLLWALAEARHRERLGLWLIAGFLCGLLSLLRENMLIVVIFLLFLTYRKQQGLSSAIKKGGIFLLGVIIVLLPVAVRNWKVGGLFLPTTFQGGVNFYIGNNPQANGSYQPIVPGKQIPAYERTEPIRIAEEEMGKSLSPMEVSNFWLKKSLAWAKSQPLDFIELQLKKLLMFWSWYEWPDAVDYYYVRKTSLVLKLPLAEFGGVFILAMLGIWLARRQLSKLISIWLFILAWMVSTVIFFLFSRYRLPCLPAIIILAAFSLAYLWEAWEKRKWQTGSVLSLLLAFSLVFPHCLGFQPQLDLVHYNLALVYEHQGQIDKAAAHYQQAAALNPNDFLSRINLGNLAARNNNWRQALTWYQQAAAIEPDSDGVQVNLGSAYIALGDLTQAEIHLNKALAINPSNIQALQNLTVLKAKRGDINKALELNSKESLRASPWLAACTPAEIKT